MPRGIPGVDLAFLLKITQRLSLLSLHTYRPGSCRSAAALVLRFDDDTQRVLTSAMSAFRAAAQQRGPRDLTEQRGSSPLSSLRGKAASSSSFSSSSVSAPSISRATGGSDHPDPLRFLEYLGNPDNHSQNGVMIDADGLSTLQLLFLKRANTGASRWSGQVVFPGGRRDPDDDADDFDAVCRETYEGVGFPLQHHREFVCLGRLPDRRVHSRLIDHRGLVQTRFVFLHVGDSTPTVRFDAHEVESVRWVPLRLLTSASLKRGQVVHPLTSFVDPMKADTRLLLGEVFPNTYLSFRSIQLPGIPSPSPSFTTGGESEAEASSFRDDDASSKTRRRASSETPRSTSWQIWGLTLRSVNEFLALGSRQVSDWPLVESNNRLLQYGVIFPMHGYYELLYQLYWWRAWIWAKVRLRGSGGCFARQFEMQKLDEPHSSVMLGRTRNGSCSPRPLVSSPSREQQRLRQVVFGSPIERRHAVLPVSADALLFTAPEVPSPGHMISCMTVLCIAMFSFYTVAAVMAGVCTTVGAALDQGAKRGRNTQGRAHSDASPPERVTPHQSSAGGHAELGFFVGAMPDGDASLSAVHDAPTRDEAEALYTGRDGQLHDPPLPPDLSVAAGEAPTPLVLDGRPHLSDHSAASCEAAGRGGKAAVSALLRHPASVDSVEAHLKLTGTTVDVERPAVGLLRVVSTASLTTNSSSPANSSAATMDECGSGGDKKEPNMYGEQTAWREGVQGNLVAPDVVPPAEHLVGASSLRDGSELSHEEELQAVMLRYRPRTTAVP